MLSERGFHPSFYVSSERNFTVERRMTKSPTASFLAAAIDESGLTRREISKRAGFDKRT